ncbi:uncharacterized protein EHS24_003199 [Apiotrichum porosum]|uniref:Uncharacterized protein n=1 Tax=Apiotrichum porosum TaxID=105984 RepID=A0A427XFH5_9TREE|nr:uncharacterized protein EHS24_003199 [Apiotrichum porosum]RSH77639.1 hypothetical protein EHS24_003199 [Apiotrichum porosum]
MHANDVPMEKIQAKVSHRFGSDVTDIYLRELPPTDIGAAVFGGQSRMPTAIHLHPLASRSRTSLAAGPAFRPASSNLAPTPVSFPMSHHEYIAVTKDVLLGISVFGPAAWNAVTIDSSPTSTHGLFSKYPMLPPIANFGPFLDPPPFSYTLRDSQDTECLDLEVVSMAIDLELHKAGRFSCSCDESSHSRSVVLEHLVEYHSLWIPENVAKIVSAILDDDMDVVATLLPRPTYSFAAACWDEPYGVRVDISIPDIVLASGSLETDLGAGGEADYTYSG